MECKLQRGGGQLQMLSSSVALARIRASIPMPTGIIPQLVLHMQERME
jgi:hypothetical protein